MIRTIIHVIIILHIYCTLIHKHFSKIFSVCRQHGVTMFSIGIGKYVDQKELRDISSNPDEDFTFHVKHFDALTSITDKLALQTCSTVAKSASKRLTPNSLESKF